MATNEKERLCTLVNSSGFLFQLEIEHEIRTKASSDGWKIISSEHPWQDPESNREEGYIDMIVSASGLPLGQPPPPEIRAILECKRTSEYAEWVFLLSSDSQKNTNIVRCSMVNKNGNIYHANVSDIRMMPYSHQAEFCVIRNQDHDRPMLERLASILVNSTRCIQLEEIRMKETSSESYRIYVPVIVTTASLKICTLEPRDILNGRLKEDACSFESVDFIRFRKTLTNRLSRNTVPKSLQEAHQDKERTVFIVTNTMLVDFLRNLDIQLS